jgi:integrase
MSVRKLRNGKWQAIINDKEVFGDERPSKCFDREKEAKDWVSSHTNEWKFRKGMADKRNATIRQLAEAYERHLDDRVEMGDLEASTRRLLMIGVRNDIVPRLGDMKCADLVTDMAQAIVRGCNGHNGKAYNIMRSLFDMVGLAVRKGYIDRSPFERDPVIMPPVCRRADDEIPSGDELHRLLQVVENPHPGLTEIEALYDNAFVRLGMHQGLRHGEVAALRRPEACGSEGPDVDLDNNVIRILYSFCNVTQKLKEPKSENGKRTIGMTIPVRNLLQRIIELPANGSTGLIFVTARGCDWYQTIGYRWHYVMSRAGLMVPNSRGRPNPKFDFHSMRHVLGSHLLKMGTPIPKCARLLGHTIQTFIKAYAREIDQHDHAWDELNEVARWLDEGATALLTSPEVPRPPLLLDAPDAKKMQRRPGKWRKS